MTDYDNTKKLSGIPPWPVLNPHQLGEMPCLDFPAVRS
jgi:hypothetical protein